MKNKTKGFLNVQKNKPKYAGVHLLLEFWGAENIDSLAKIKEALTQAVKAAEATLLKVDLHKFSPQGISGVAIIAESHISIHTWPEYQYAAIDIFTCGEKARPYQAVDILKKWFNPVKVEITEIKRGIMFPDASLNKEYGHPEK